MNGIQLENYDVAISVQRDPNGMISSGLVVGDILTQNQALIISIHPGDLKERPSMGVGIEDMLLDHDYPAWRAAIREQLEMDGQTVHSVKITSSSIVIDAEY